MHGLLCFSFLQVPHFVNDFLNLALFDCVSDLGMLYYFGFDGNSSYGMFWHLDTMFSCHNSFAFFYSPFHLFIHDHSFNLGFFNAGV